FHEWFRGAELSHYLGYKFGLSHANCSVSRAGVVRGIHFTEVPPGQAKYVVCASGAIIDVVVDLRVGCPTFARWKAVQLDDEKRRAVFISEGLGHAFVALSEQATVMYLCSTPYAPSVEHGVHPLHPDLGIAWPREIEPLDAAGPSVDEAQRDGLLPLYSDCMAFAAQLKETAAPGPDRATGAPRQPGEP